jgi:hypothetical protein
MSEREPINTEKEKIEVAPERITEVSDKPVVTIETEKEISEKKAEIARANIDDLAKSKEEVPVAGDLSADNKDHETRWTSKELLSQTYQRSLTSIRNRLSKPEKNLSKVVHNPVVEKTSEILGKTAARPSGILFGSIFSFVGSLVGYIIARRLGGELPYSIFAFLFVGGFVFGLLLEILVLLYRKRKLK